MVLDSLFEVLEFDVRVDLRRIQVTMAEQLLHVTEAGAATQEMRRAAGQSISSILLAMQALSTRTATLPENQSYTPGIMPRKSTKTRPQQGVRLAELRKDAGLSQYELARYVGVPQANIAFWERSEKPPRSDVLPKMAQVLGVTVEDLLIVGDEKPLKKQAAKSNSRPRRQGA